jgi:hypothetical protein
VKEGDTMETLGVIIMIAALDRHHRVYRFR